MAGERLDSEARREQISAAALELFGTRAVSEVGMGDVARRVGLVPSAIYRHFRGKDEVLDAVLDLIEQHLMRMARTAQSEEGSCLERLRRLLLRHVRFVRENQAIPRVIFSGEITSHNPARKARVYGIIQAYMAEVAELAREGQRRGEIRAEVRPESVAALLLGIVQPGAVLWHLSDGGFDVTKHAQRSWELLEAAIAKADA